MKLSLLGLFLLMVVLTIIIFSFFYNSQYIEGVENKLKMTDMTDAKGFVKTYNKTVEEKSCKIAIDKLRTINASNSPQINKIINENLDLSNCAVVDKIYELNNDAKVTEVINTCFGGKYEAALNLITNLKSSKVYKSDKDFEEFMKTIKEPVINGNKSTALEIDEYIDLLIQLQETK